MNEHMWVEFRYVPVTVELQPDESLSVFASEEGLETADKEAMIGCWFCHTPLNHESFSTECESEGQKEV